MIFKELSRGLGVFEVTGPVGGWRMAFLGGFGEEFALEEDINQSMGIFFC